MGRFNFDAYQAELEEKKLQKQKPRIKTFIPLRTKRTVKSSSETRNLIHFNRTGCSLSKAMFSHVTTCGRYAEYMLQGNILAIRFMKEPTDYSYSWTVNPKKQTITAGLKGLLSLLEKQTDCVNFNVYRYTFELEQDSENVFYLELDRPYEKKKRSEKRK
ncbi:hypothetical protein D2A61_12265 [Enterococcus faecalis]|uniref:hypothetical protein n=1 Tax=Enterococcus TaxID=1350 RepID=UPI000DE8EDE6|nr:MULTISPECIES: hypothetical protein [Enterococcus]EGO6656631.1 hypothetical protein [Enterococcus faecalis]EGO7558370.1 hypothetical protein [Enterococcus faecalis]EGO7930284.1 hypothetical protein [Enterococcus faecalis]EGO8425425.1 hypothetical protein [Enterococcus faecalis]EGO8726940.1 hypothetical protein [Enterococcus faecalis]